MTRSCLPGTRTRRAVAVVLDPEPLEAGPDGDEMLRDDVLDHELALGDGAEADEARDLDVVGADPPLAAVEPLDARGSGGRSSRSPRSRRRARRGSGRDPGRAARRRRFRSRSRPRARTAAMTAFSVPVTDASSRKSVRADEPVRAHVEAPVRVATCAPSRSSASMWVSIRRRPITSPPGGGTIASPARASSGPASRIEARMRLQSSSSSSCFGIVAAWIRTSPFAAHARRRRRGRRASSSIVSTSVIAGTFASDDRLVRQEAGGDDRERRVLVAGRADRAVERAARPR